MLKNFKNGYAVSEGSTLAAGEKNDCVVRAFANACDVTYNSAHTVAKEVFGRENNRGVQAFSFLMKRIKTITFDVTGQLSLFDSDKKVITVKHIGDAPKMGGELINPKYKHKKVAYTVKEFARKYNKGNYIIQVKGHALAIKNGVICDNGNYQTTGYRRVVEAAFRMDA